MMNKLKEWIKRYLPAEIFAIIGAIIGGVLAHILSENLFVTAISATAAENIGFYGQILYVDLRERKIKDEKITFLGSLKVLRNIILEFGVAEYIDSLLIRPAAMYYFPQLIDNIPVGILIGKLVADVTFYIPTVIAYELRKRYVRD